MTPRVGQVIRLEDARGCWRLHTVSTRDRRFENALELAGQAWSGLRFLRHVEVTREENRVVCYRSLLPAIGHAEAPFSHLHLPAGWHAPALVRTS